ncbi:hypothetical protein CHUAL_003609 [Chamberlinius hualienensis]
MATVASSVYYQHFSNGLFVLSIRHEMDQWKLLLTIKTASPEGVLTENNANTPLQTPKIFFIRFKCP